MLNIIFHRDTDHLFLASVFWPAAPRVGEKVQLFGKDCTVSDVCWYCPDVEIRIPQVIVSLSGASLIELAFPVSNQNHRS